jgi:hypothetical protein
MNKKLFYLSILLVFVLVLSGCSEYPTAPGTPTNEEAQIKSTVYEFYLSISAQNWNKARSYCLPGSDQYYSVSQLESLVNSIYLYCNTITINALVNILDVSITGNYSQVYCFVSLRKTICGYVDIEEDYGYMYLQKIGNTWKLY